MEREFLDSEVMAIIPVYKAGMGDISKIYLKSKEEFEVNKNVKSLIKKMEPWSLTLRFQPTSYIQPISGFRSRFSVVAVDRKSIV